MSTDSDEQRHALRERRLADERKHAAIVAKREAIDRAIRDMLESRIGPVSDIRWTSDIIPNNQLPADIAARLQAMPRGGTDYDVKTGSTVYRVRLPHPSGDGPGGVAEIE